MATLEYNNIAISGIAAAVPKQVIDNLKYSKFFSEKSAKSIIKTTGISHRRFASADTTSADLGFFATRQLLNGMNLNPVSIDGLIFVTLTPDYRMPGNAFLLHQRLGLSKDSFAFDISLGCSGYIYGLSQAFNYLEQDGIDRIILINSEVKSKVYSKEDKSTSLLFGDGATATLIEKKKGKHTLITLNSDGKHSSAIIIPGGGYRMMASEKTLEYLEREEGNHRSLEQGTMDGATVFDFTITEVPENIKKTFDLGRLSPNEIDYFIFHQANKFITDHFAKKLKIDSSKVYYSLHKYGNTASVSIPLTIVSELKDKIKPNSTLFLSGFGVGLSWGSVITEIEDLYLSDIYEV